MGLLEPEATSRCYDPACGVGSSIDAFFRYAERAQLGVSQWGDDWDLADPAADFVPLWFSP